MEPQQQQYTKDQMVRIPLRDRAEKWCKTLNLKLESQDLFDGRALDQGELPPYVNTDNAHLFHNNGAQAYLALRSGSTFYNIGVDAYFGPRSGSTFYNHGITVQQRLLTLALARLQRQNMTRRADDATELMLCWVGDVC